MRFDSESLRLKLRFLTVGLIGFFVNYIVLSISIALGLHQVPGEVVAAIVALQVTFVCHDQWTYLDKSSPLRRNITKRYAMYIASNSFGSVMTVVIFSFITQFISFHLVSLGLAAVAAMIWNYVINKVYIWQHVAKEEN